MSSESTDRSGRVSVPEWLVLLAVFAVGFVIILSRKPDAVTHAQFFIEDGINWYAQAHDVGPFAALPMPHRGYFVLVQRLGALVAIGFPFAWAPLVMALFAVAVDVLPAVFVASSRLASAVPSRAVRLLLAFLCLALPSAWGQMANVTNSMWYLGPLACMVVLATPPAGVAWRVFDLGAVILSGLSGPFAILLAPVAALKWYVRRERWTFVLLSATVVTALVQVASILHTPKPAEGRMALGADVMKFGRLVVRRVVYEGLFGQRNGMKLATGEWGEFWITRPGYAVAAVVLFAILFYVVRKAPFELFLFVVYAALTFGASIAWPGPAQDGDTWWDQLLAVSNGSRYFLAPALALLFVLVWMATSKQLVARATGVLLLAVTTVLGIVPHWREPGYPNYDFPEIARRYAAAQPGERFVFLTPPNWGGSITKRADEPAVEVPDECVGDVSIPVTLLGSNLMTWEGADGTGQGGDQFAVFRLPARQQVCAVRVTFVLTNPTSQDMMVQAYWADSARESFANEERNSAVYVKSQPGPQTATFHVHGPIDLFRLDPGVEQGNRFEVERITLLTEPNGARP